jgi:copper transport protein
VRRHIRRALLPVILLLTLLGTVLGPAAEVSAHASVSSTNPSDGSVLAELPEFIEIVFNEKVTVAEGSARLIDATGAVTDLAERSNEPADVGARVRWDLPERTGTGWYAVSWRAVSEDGHGINGSFTFFYGDPEDAGAAAKAEKIDDPTAKFINISHLLRGGTYVSVLLAVGLLAALWTVSGAAASSADPRLAATLRRGSTAFAILGLILTPLTLLNNALLLNGGSWDSIAIIVQIVLQSSVGAALLVRMSALFGLCTAVLLLAEKGTRIIGAVIGVLAAAGLADSFALGGHVAVVPWRIAGSIGEVLHLLSASVWLGGIPGVAWILVRRRGLGAGAVAEIVERFSKLATVSVVSVFIGGSILASAMFTSPAELFTERYGVILLVKFLLVAIVGGIGAYNHFVLVPGLRKATTGGAEAVDGDDDAHVTSSNPTVADNPTTGDAGTARAHLKRSLLTEAGLLVAIVVATAALTAEAAPAAGGNHFAGGGHSHLGGGEGDLGLGLTLDDFEPTVVRAPLGTGEAVLEILPARAGAENRFVFTAFDGTGATRELNALTGSFSLARIDIGPLERSFEAQPDGSWSLATRDLGVEGTWKLELLVTFADGSVDIVNLDAVIEPAQRSAP